MQQLAIIGFGQFGQLAARHLNAHYDIIAYDTAPNLGVATTLNIPFVPLEQAARAPIVLLCIPTQAMQQTLTTIAPHLQPGALVIDVCSVKTHPCQWMLDLLPPHVDSISTHPLFGPQTVAAGVKLLKVAVCPLRISPERLERFNQALTTLGLTPMLTTPEEHDQHLAYVLSLTHLIGRALINLDTPATPFATHSYNQLLTLCEIMRPDTAELFHSLQHLNPYAHSVTEAFAQEINNLLNPKATLENQPHRPLNLTEADA